MFINRTAVVRSGIKWHRLLGYLGGLAVFIWACSGILHPIMSWTGPKSAAFFPPTQPFKAGDIAAIPKALQKNNITQANVVKIVPSRAQQKLLQITDENALTRRYFDSNTGSELVDYDKSHAAWLASYYTGLPEPEITNITLKNQFDDEYPWVNRLLPVYRVEFADADNLVAFIHTETNALASLNNDSKKNMQVIFKFLHTWSWLDDVEYARVILMLAFLLCLFGMAVTGLQLVLFIKSRKIADTKRRWHRWVGYAIWIPLLCYSTSGIYHLIQSSVVAQETGFKLAKKMMIDPLSLATTLQTESALSGKTLNNISLILGPRNTLLYRMSVATKPHKAHQHVSKSEKFDGVAKEKSSFYFDAKTGNALKLTDKQVASSLGERFTGMPASEQVSVKPVTHFSMHYDFRNKRLPVWEVNYQDENAQKLFVDPATGQLIDKSRAIDRAERMSFSILHKWNIVGHFIGRQNRDIIVVAVLSIAVIFTIIGYLMMFARRRKAS